MSSPAPFPPLAEPSDGVVALRELRPADVDQVYAACRDGEIGHAIPLPDPYRRGDAEAYVRRARREWASGTAAALAIVMADDDEVVLGAIDLRRRGDVGNIGYWVASGVRHLGVATRALQLLTAWALGPLGLGMVILEIRPDNVASQHVASSAGYHREGTLDVNDRTGERGNLIYARLAGSP